MDGAGPDVYPDPGASVRAPSHPASWKPNLELARALCVNQSPITKSMRPDQRGVYANGDVARVSMRLDAVGAGTR